MGKGTREELFPISGLEVLPSTTSVLNLQGEFCPVYCRVSATDTRGKKTTITEL
jgi:hypothetical protein